MQSRLDPRVAKAALPRIALALLLALSAASSLRAQESAAGPCGTLQTATGGPWDYRIQRGENLSMVERHHFTAAVESLANGVTVTRENIASDIGYTLRAFPNHHRALAAMVRLSEQRKTNRPPTSEFTVDCYFERALRFTADDTVVRVLFASYLGKRGQKDLAIRHLELATEHAKDYAFSHYNIGLLYFELGMFDRALAQAHRAQQLGMTRPDLANMLKRENKWQEPTS
jgi:tetratricopeptide (TPR) repeat protein